MAIKPAEVFPLCEFLVEELQVRVWGLEDLSRHTILHPDRLEAILGGSRITFEEAEHLGAGLGVSAALLLTLQMTWLRRQREP